MLLHDDDAISPVTGITLMVAISIVLAAVIAGVIIGGDDALLTTSPQATFEFTYSSSGTADADLATGGNTVQLAVAHVGGDTVDASKLTLKASPGGTASESQLSWSGDVTAGSGSTVTVDADAMVSVVHSDSGGSTALARWEGPDA